MIGVPGSIFRSTVASRVLLATVSISFIHPGKGQGDILFHDALFVPLVRGAFRFLPVGVSTDVDVSCELPVCGFCLYGSGNTVLISLLQVIRCAGLVVVGRGLTQEFSL